MGSKALLAKQAGRLAVVNSRRFPVPAKKFPSMLRKVPGLLPHNLA
jgi:hypothetical protein